MSDVTQILQQMDSGSSAAADRLLPLVYEELRQLAAVKMSHEHGDHSLNATALVHEAYLRLAGSIKPGVYRNRGHFFSVAAKAMRRILVDRARARQVARRGRNRLHEHLVDVPIPAADAELLALDDALKTLAERDPIKSQLVELRYFAGLTLDQAATALGISPSAADRIWAFTRVWLMAEIRGT